MNFTWSDKDKANIVDFLNLIAEKGQFTLTVKESIKFYGYLSYLQKDLLSKIDASIVEVISVKEVNKPKDKKK